MSVEVLSGEVMSGEVLSGEVLSLTGDIYAKNVTILQRTTVMSQVKSRVFID
jgi:predicted acyltransferase (DUF342 family)